MRMGAMVSYEDRRMHLLSPGKSADGQADSGVKGVGNRTRVEGSLLPPFEINITVAGLLQRHTEISSILCLLSLVLPASRKRQALSNLSFPLADGLCSGRLGPKWWREMATSSPVQGTVRKPAAQLQVGARVFRRVQFD
jgi:hypothetical protein